MITSVLVLVGMIAVMFWLQWRLTLLALTTAPLFWFSTVRITRLIRESAQKQRRREGAMAAIAAEAIGSIEVVQALSLEEAFSEDFSGRNKKSQKEDLKANRYSARLGRTVDVLLAISSALVLWYGGLLIIRGELSPGNLVVLLRQTLISSRTGLCEVHARLARPQRRANDTGTGTEA
jgi:ATP-binding cassette subfamily B protein